LSILDSKNDPPDQIFGIQKKATQGSGNSNFPKSPWLFMLTLILSLLYYIIQPSIAGTVFNLPDQSFLFMLFYL